MSYFTIDSIDRNECEQLIEKGKRIGSGVYGTVYEACKNGDCRFIIKVITYKEDRYKNSGEIEQLSEEYIKNNWKKEVYTHTQMNQCQEKYMTCFSPLIYDAWYCKKNNETDFIILMEKYDGSLMDFISNYSDQKERKMSFIIIDQALKRLFLSLQLVHINCQICLNDIKLDNILYKQMGEANYEFVFADFGTSTFHPTPECKDNDRKRLLHLWTFKTPILSIKKFK